MANEKFLSSVGLTHLWSELKKKFVLNVSKHTSGSVSVGVTIGEISGSVVNGFDWDGQTTTIMQSGNARVECYGEDEGLVSITSGGKTIRLTETGMANLLKCLNGDYNAKSTDKIAVDA